MTIKDFQESTPKYIAILKIHHVFSFQYIMTYSRLTRNSVFYYNRLDKVQYSKSFDVAPRWGLTFTLRLFDSPWSF